MFVRRSPASDLVRPSIRSAIRAGRRLGWRLSWICVAVLSLSAGTPGQVADHGVSEAAALSRRESKARVERAEWRVAAHLQSQIPIRKRLIPRRNLATIGTPSESPKDVGHA